MPPRRDQLYRENDMCNFCIYTENVGAPVFPQLKHSEGSLMLLPEELNLPRLPGPLRRWVG